MRPGSDYVLETLVGKSPTWTVYRARRKQDGSPVIVKRASSEDPSGALAARLRHEFELLQGLQLPDVLAAIALEPTDHGLALVLEYRGSRTLRSVILAAALSVPERLALAVRLADVVASLHGRKIIHKELRPEHFALADDDAAVTLVHFDSATWLSHEAGSSRDLGSCDLAYVSPEQTGRMNRAIDLRSDLYSLGVTLYELFTGSLPFTAADPFELVNCHVGQPVRAPHELSPELPAVLSAILVKLLSKAPEQRYQSATGLKTDLERCAREWSERGAASEFALAEADNLGELRIPRWLYGRASELAALQRGFERARAGSVELISIAGGAGVGKAALVHELDRVFVRERRLISGKFELRAQSTPYAPLVHGCRVLLRGVLAQPKERWHAWQLRFRSALATNGRLITDLMPELQTLIGVQPALTDLGPSEARQRFENTLQRFLGALAGPEHTLVLFLDDLQWADPASLRLLQLLATEREAGPMLIVAAHRDSEVTAQHPLRALLANLRSAGAELSELALAALSPEHVRELLRDALHAPAESVTELADLVWLKTNGNPLFVRQFLAAVHRQGILYFDPAVQAWRWDVAAIERVAATDDVVTSIRATARELPGATRPLFELAGCLGHEFDRATLCVVSERSPSEVTNALWPLLSLGLVVPLDDNYRFRIEDGQGAGALNARYRFAHALVQEAAAGLTSEGERPALHVRIGRLILAAAGGDPDGDSLFAVVDHWNLAPALLSAAEQHQLAQLNLRAGLCARNAAAHELGSLLLGRSIAGFGAEGWENEHASTSRAHFAKAECDFLGGKPDQAFALLSLVTAHCHTNLERASVAALEIGLLIKLNRLREATDCGIGALRHLGMPIPLDAGEMGPAVGQALASVTSALSGRDLGSLADLPPLSDPEILASCDLVFRLIPAAFQADQGAMALMILHAVTRMLAHGNAPAAPHLYLIFSLIYGDATGNGRAAFEIARAGVALNDRLPASSLVAAACHFVYAGFVSHWWRPLPDSLAHLERGRRAALQAGDNVHVAYCATYDLSHRFSAGVGLAELLPRVQDAARLHARNGDAIGVLWVDTLGQTLAGLRGQPWSALGPDPAAVSGEGNPTLRAAQTIYLAIGSYLLGDTRAAFAHANEAEALAVYTRGMLLNVERVFTRALACARLYASADQSDRVQLLEALRVAADMLNAWATAAPHNTGHRASLVAAELAAIDGMPDAALSLYDRAITDARSNGFVQHHALANESCGLFHLQRGRHGVARVYLGEAYRGYLQWGADAVARRLASAHPFVVGGASLDPAPADKLEELGGAMRAAAAISREVERPALIAAVLQTCGQIANADAIALLLADSSGLVVVGHQRAGEAPVVLPDPKAASETVCLSIVQEAARTGRALVLDDALSDPRFGREAEVERRQLRSVLALPLSQGQSVTGVLYFEHGRNPAAFPPERVRVLELLAEQAAISLTTARHYGDRSEALVSALAASQESTRLKSELLATTTRALAEPLDAMLAAPAAVSERLFEQAVLACEACGSQVIVRKDAPSRCPCCGAGSLQADVLCLYRGTHEAALRDLVQLRLQGEQLQQRLNELVDTSTLRIELGPVRLSELAGEVVVGLAELAAARGVRLRVDAASNDNALTGDRASLRQVLFNLVANAVRSSEPDTDVVIELATARGAAVMRVRDQGRASAPEDVERATPIDGVDQRGNGAELSALCRYIVELHGGSIEVESAPGRGSTYSVHLPLSAAG